MSRSREGSASIWVLSAAALVLVVGMAGWLRCAAVFARHRAEAAADLAALAAAGRIGVDEHECAVAAAIAAANGARLIDCRLKLGRDSRSGWVLVQVSVGLRLPVLGPRSATARARAARKSPIEMTNTVSRRCPAVACWPRPAGDALATSAPTRGR